MSRSSATNAQRCRLAVYISSAKS
ncbi:MAG: hypothetical protein QOE89_315, partial [Pseudonocardiales bacterium]|nr:hypothetical protein [Pseudonocardiales bacterium]